MWSDLYFENKKAEFRKNDRNYLAGDSLELTPVDDNGELVDDVDGPIPMELEVTHIVHGPKYGIPDGFCMMSVELTEH